MMRSRAGGAMRRVHYRSKARSGVKVQPAPRLVLGHLSDGLIEGRAERISTTATFAGSSHNRKGITRKAQTGFTTDSRPLVTAMPVRGDPRVQGGWHQCT